MSPELRDSCLGNRIRLQRQRHGLSQGTLARRASIHPSYLSRIEHGKIQPSLQMALRLAGALKMPLGDLMGSGQEQQKGGTCPISPSGQCFVELTDTGAGPTLPKKSPDYSPRRIFVLREFAIMLEHANPDLLSALGTLIQSYSKRAKERDNGNGEDKEP